MNRFFITIVLALAALTANAQDILNELRHDQSGQGKIVVNQSKEIEQLVNSKTQTVKADSKAQAIKTDMKTQTVKTDTKTQTVKTDATSTHATTYQTPQDKTTVKPVEKKEQDHVIAIGNDIDTIVKDTIAQGPRKRVVRKNKDTVEADGSTEGSVRLNSKVMRHAYKTTGYRVQVYTGGNTRADRQKCQEIAARIKASYPNMPIYVHFYSPSWKCRAGNFTNKNEAENFLRKIKAMGYKTAVLVKGTISVQY